MTKEGKTKKPSIPKLPETTEELRKLLKKEFKILDQSNPVSATRGGEYHPGDVALIVAKKECPFCGLQFDVTIEGGCFGGSKTLHFCPNCNFPHNVIRALLHNKGNKEKKEG